MPLRRNANDGKPPAPTLGRPKVIKFAGKTWALGLFWLTTTARGGDLVRAARQEAAAPGIEADLFVVRQGDLNGQVGLGRVRDGLRAGERSAAAAIADGTGGSLLAVFAMEGGHWVVAVQDEMILPDGDWWTADRDEARAHFDALLGQGAWQRVVAPAGWHHTAEELPLAEMLQDRAAVPRLRQTNALRRLLPLLLAGAAVLVLAGGTVALLQHRAAEAEREAMIEAIRRAQQAEKITAPKTWQQRAMPSLVIGACLDGAAAVPPTAPGWELQGIACDGAAGSLNWRYARAGGTVAWLSTWAREKAADLGVVVGEGGDQADVGHGIPMPPARGPVELASTGDRTVMRFYAMLQATATQGSLGPLQVIGPPPGVEEKDWQPPPFATMSYELRTLQPTSWLAYLDEHAGMVVATVHFDAAQGVWVIKGDIYVKL